MRQEGGEASWNSLPLRNTGTISITFVRGVTAPWLVTSARSGIMIFDEAITTQHSDLGTRLTAALLQRYDRLSLHLTDIWH